MEYYNLEIEDYTLYGVYDSKKYLTLFKLYNLVYGLILKHLNRDYFKILNYKKHYGVENCDYSTTAMIYEIQKSLTMLIHIRVY